MNNGLTFLSPNSVRPTQEGHEHWRDRGRGGGQLYPSLFVNPISNRWADYAHHIANCLPPDFSDPPTAHTIWDTPPIQDDDNKNESIGFTFSY